MSKSQKFNTIIPQFESSLPTGCERFCRTRFELNEEKAKNYQLVKDIEKYKQDTVSLFRQLSLVFALNLYVDRMKDLPFVDSIYIIKKEDMLDIWTFIRKVSLSEEEKVADAQCELMRVHQELNFDFMVIPKTEKEAENLLPSSSVQIYPKNDLW